MKSKRQLGMYTLTLNDDGSLQIQAPTLIRPLSIEARQVQDLQQWLNDLQLGNASPNAAVQAVNAGPTPEVAITAAPEATVNEPPETVAQRVIQGIISNASANYPETLAPENRDRFIEQVTRNATIRPLMSQGKVSYKQVTIWVETQLGTGLY